MAEIGGAAEAPPLRALFRVGAATSLVVLAFSMLNPVLAVRLQTAGVPTAAIGVFAMLQFASIVLTVPWMPRVFDLLGVARAYRLGLGLQMSATLGYAFSDHYGLWCVLSLLAGLGGAAAWNATEALIAHNAPPERRGRLTGLYQTALGAGLALGPFLPGLLPLSPRGLSGLAAVCLVLAMGLTLSSGVGRLRTSHVDAPALGLLAALKQVKGLAWLALAGGGFEAGLGVVTTAYGSQSGLSLGAAASIAGVLGAGSFLLQYPSGWLADRLGPRQVFSVAGLSLLAASAAFAGAARWPLLLWACAFVWGAVGGALYTLTMIRVAHQFARSSAIAGAAAMITGYTLGGTLGPSFSGLVLDTFGVAGQAAWLSLLALSVLGVARGAGWRAESEGAGTS